jgi:hypothetical protein
VLEAAIRVKGSLAILAILIANSSLGAEVDTGLESSPSFRKVEKEPISDFNFENVDVAEIVKSLSVLFGRKPVLAPDAHARVTLRNPAPIQAGEAWESLVLAARNGGLEVQADSKYVYLFKKGAKRPKPPKPSRPVPLPTDGSTVTLSKKKLRQNLEGLENQAQAVPNFDQGKPNGTTVIGIRPGSVFGMMKMESGDVICGINDEENLAPTLFLTLRNALERVVEGGSMRICLRRGQRQSFFLVRGR